MDGNNYYNNGNQPQYDEYPAEQPLRMNVQGLISMILGILGCVFGIACGWYPAFTVWPVLLDLAAIALGIVGLTRKNRRKKGMATAGLILGIVGIVLLIIVFVIGVILGIAVIGGGTALSVLEEMMQNY